MWLRRKLNFRKKKEFNGKSISKKKELGKKTIKIGIGINTGMVSKLVKLPYS